MTTRAKRVRARKDAERIIDASGVVELVDPLLPSKGRPRQLPLRTLLVGCVMTAMLKQPLHICRVREVLLDMSRKHRLRLGVSVFLSDGEIHDLTERQIYRLFANFISVIDPTPVPGFKGVAIVDRQTKIDSVQPSDEELSILEERLQQVANRLLEGSIPAQFRNASTSYALDWTDADTWASGHRSFIPLADPDADWGARRSMEPGIKRAKFYGYDEQILTMTNDDDGPKVPELVRRIDLQASNEHDPEFSIPMIDRALADGLTINDLLADNAYPYALEWSVEMRRRKIQLIVDLHPGDRGPKGTWLGALDIEGNLYCPSTPKNLQRIDPPGVRANGVEREHYRTQIDLRDKYKFVVQTATDDEGYDRRMCPAVAGKVHCPLWDRLYDREKAIPEIYTPPKAPNKCCTQKTITVPPTVSAKTRQKHDFGSRTFKDSYKRRTAVERAFGDVKSKAGEDVSRGRIRLMGRTKQLFMRTIAYVARNTRIVARFIEKSASPPVPFTRAKRRKQAWPPLANSQRADDINDVEAEPPPLAS